MGQPNVDTFVRFYTTPGANHSGTGLTTETPLPQGVDLLAALDVWVTKGEAPGDLVQVAKEAKAPFALLAMRPMCRYPAYRNTRAMAIRSAPTASTARRNNG